MDIHIVADKDVMGICREEGRITISAATVEREPEHLYGIEARDAYLHVPVSEKVHSLCRMRVGRAGSPGRREGGNVWQLVSSQ